MSTTKHIVREWHNDPGLGAPSRRPPLVAEHGRDRRAHHDQSPLRPRAQGVRPRRRPDRRADTAALVVQAHPEQRGVWRLPLDESLGGDRLRVAQGIVEERSAGLRRRTARASVLPASAGVLAFGVIVVAYVATNRDRWVAPSNGIVKIGVIVPTGGPYAVLGNSFLKAVQMAQSDLRGTKYRYQLVLVDVGQDPGQARTAILHAIRDERVDAIVGGISRFGQITRPLATQARILHTCVCSVTSIGDGAYNFTNIPSPEAEGVRWVQEAQRRGIRTIALLTQEFADSVTDFRKMIARARASHPDVYYVEALNPQLDELAQQLADAKIRNIASVVAPSVSQRPDLFEATWYTDSNLRDFVFKTRFERLYPGTQFATHMMPYAYDDFNMIVQAFERGANPAVYVRDIRSYEGNAGTLTKGQGSGNFQSTPAVWEIEHGKPVLLSHQ